MSGSMAGIFHPASRRNWIVSLLSVAGRFCSGGIAKSRRQAAGSGDPVGAGHHKWGPVANNTLRGDYPELRTPETTNRVLESRYVLTGDAQLLKESSAPGDGGWAVAARPDRRKGRAQQSWSAAHLPEGLRSEDLSLYLQGPVMDRQEGRPTVGAGRPAAPGGRS
jgi:hypothetical protein